MTMLYTIDSLMNRSELDLDTLVKNLKCSIQRNDIIFGKIFCYVPEDDIEVKKLQLIFQRHKIPTCLCKNTFSSRFCLGIKIKDYRNISTESKQFVDTLHTRLDNKCTQTYQTTLDTFIKDYIQTDDGWIFLYPYKLTDFNRVCDALIHNNIDAQKYMISNDRLPLDKLWDGWDNVNRRPDTQHFVYTVRFPAIRIQQQYGTLSANQKQIIDNIIYKINETKKQKNFYLQYTKLVHDK